MYYENELIATKWKLARRDKAMPCLLCNRNKSLIHINKSVLEIYESMANTSERIRSICIPIAKQLISANLYLSVLKICESMATVFGIAYWVLRIATIQGVGPLDIIFVN